MARQRRTSEITRMLKRRMASMDSDKAVYIARELREFALTLRFLDGYSCSWIAEHDWLARVASRDDVERYVRSHTSVRGK